MMRWSETGRRTRLLLAGAGLLCLLVLGGAAWLFYDAQMDAQLLRAAPDTVPGNAKLMAFAMAHGESVFKDNCAACHGADAKGDHALGAPNLTDRDWLYGSGRPGEIEQTVNYGIRAQDPRGWNLADMPAFSHPVPYSREKLLPLSPSDVSDVEEFLFQQERRPADAAAADRGKHIFDGRGACWDCHGEDAHGDNAVGAPNLVDNIWLIGDGSRADLSYTIENGRQGVCPAWLGRLSAAQVREVSLYVYALSHLIKEASR